MKRFCRPFQANTTGPETSLERVIELNKTCAKPMPDFPGITGRGLGSSAGKAGSAVARCTQGTWSQVPILPEGWIL